MSRLSGDFCRRLAVAIGLTVAAAGAWADDFAEYWRLSASDPNTSTGSSFTRATWLNPNGSGETEAVIAGRKYYVPADIMLRTPWTTASFAGSELAVAGTLYDGTGNASLLTVPYLRLLPGGIYRYSNSSILSADSTLSVEGTGENPATIQFFYFQGRWFKIRAPLSGNADSVMRMIHGSLGEYTRSQLLGTGLILENERSGFAGKMIVGTNVYVRLDTKRYFPGEIEVLSNGYLGCGFWSGTTTIGGLTLHPGAQLLLPMTSSTTYNTYTVTNRFAASGAFGISPTSAFYMDSSNTNGMTLLHLTGPAAGTTSDLSQANFSNLALGKYGPLPRTPRLEYIANGGDKDIRLAWDAVVVMKQQNVSSSGDAGTSQFAPANGGYWSTGVVPASDFNGDVLVSANNFSFEKNSDVNYPNMSVVKLNNGSIYHQATSATFRELNSVGTSIYSYGGSTGKTLNGKLVCWPTTTPTRFIGWSNIKVTVNADISGAGDLLFTSYNQTSGYNVELTGANGGFSGNVMLASTTKPCTLYLNGDSNLGGSYSGTTAWKSFTISNNSHVVVNRDVTLAEPTRGVFVMGGAQFTVPDGVKFRIDEPITYGGPVVKLGGGTLVLGGEARFSNGVSEPAATPVDGCNTLTVSAGALRAATTNALDGLAVTFAAGTALKVDLSAMDMPVRQYGFVSRKTGGALVTQATDGKIHVLFDKESTPVPPTPVCEIALCTVNTDAAQNLAFAFDNAYRAYGARVLSRENGDGSLTFLARLVYRGFRVTIR